MTIHSSAMLVTLVVHRWGATKQDNKVSTEVEAKHAATKAGKYVKYLIDKAELEEIQQLATAIRQYHISRTLAWTDGGQRILPSSLFMEYRQEVHNFKLKFFKARDDFLAKYPQLVQDARLRLGTMYDPMEYPEVSSLRNAFGIDVEFAPVPSANDFRIDMADEVKAELQEQVTADVNAKVERAVRGCWARAKDVLERIHAQCSQKNGRIFDSLMTNAQDLVDVLGGLNITNNQEIAQMEKDIRGIIVSPDAIRSNHLTRQRVAEGAADILARMPAGV